LRGIRVGPGTLLAVGRIGSRLRGRVGLHLRQEVSAAVIGEGGGETRLDDLGGNPERWMPRGRDRSRLRRTVALRAARLEPTEVTNISGDSSLRVGERRQQLVRAIGQGRGRRR